ncbi:hypothetical protein FM110_11780 [Brachybacterium nesterenkovii]|uniref:Uncharacterized protein n=1 Tax=Brachybacterium nesterenkovii TaxID=47847 RepID=A0A1X6X6G2_9MICO|nr:hypothetical protein FM110_11780 [Brachybacterium nesterenkovii]
MPSLADASARRIDPPCRRGTDRQGTRQSDPVMAVTGTA